MLAFALEGDDGVALRERRARTMARGGSGPRAYGGTQPHDGHVRDYIDDAFRPCRRALCGSLRELPRFPTSSRRSPSAPTPVAALACA